MVNTEAAWEGFAPGRWQHEIDVRNFIVRNTRSYDGDEAFLAGISDRTKAVFNSLKPYFAEEAKKGVLDVDATVPSSITAHGPGYINRANEVIVGLQTDKPFCRAIMPYGGFRMVENGLEAAGFAVDPKVKEIFSKYRKTHNDGVFDAYTPEIMRCRRDLDGVDASPVVVTQHHHLGTSMPSGGVHTIKVA